jgi:hypothetical protein
VYSTDTTTESLDAAISVTLGCGGPLVAATASAETAKAVTCLQRGDAPTRCRRAQTAYEIGSIGSAIRSVGSGTITSVTPSVLAIASTGSDEAGLSFNAAKTQAMQPYASAATMRVSTRPAVTASASAISTHGAK